MMGRGRPPGLHTTEKAQDTQGTLRRLLGYLRQQTWVMVVVIALTAVTALLDAVGPFLTGQAIDFLPQGNWEGVIRVCLARLGIGLVSATGSWLMSYLMAQVAQSTVEQLRNELITKLQTLSLRFFDRHAHGDLMSRLTNDVENVSNVLTANATQLLGSGLMVTAVTVMMFITNVPLALTTLLSLPVMLVLTRKITGFTRKRFREQQMHLGALNGIIEESVSGQRVIQAYVHEEATIATFDKANRQLQATATEAEIYSGAMGPLMNMVNNFSLAIVGAVGGWFVLRGWATVGTIASFMAYSQMFARPLNHIAMLVNTIQSALAGAERVFETLDEEPELTDKPDARPLAHIQGKVVFDNVCFGYDSGVPVLKTISMYNNPGETIALVGPTGAGKTTIINLLTRFYDVDNGSIKIDDTDLRDYRMDDLRQKVGLVLQDNFLFADTVMENIRYGRLEAT
ncbi:MAG: ABC transporter ATP-binding protein, partial [Anaerolineae bacterium]|nr:ABC transporter ATP-binding protein [Anaerolineae bacterium]